MKDELNIKNRALSMLLKHNLEDKMFLPSPQEINKWKTKNLCFVRGIKNNNYDVVIIAKEADLDVTAKYLDLYKRNLCPQNIVIITKITEKTRMLFHNKDAIVIDENELFDGLTYESAQRVNGKKTGHFFQQFLKMAYAYVCSHDQYLVFDGDTVPIKPLSFLTDGKGVFLTKGEYFKPYFSMINRLFAGQIVREVDFSFIAECMLIKKNIMIELIEKIEAISVLEGKTFFEKLLKATDWNGGLEGCFFSEYETYGNYVWKYYRNIYAARKVRSLREAMKFFNALPEPYILDYLSRDYDTVSFEQKHLQANPLGLTEYINRCFKE
jgi:hypothetical protein